MSSLKLRKEKDCLNCGHHVEENYCPHCGQENIELKEDAWHMIIHSISDYFHFENKFFGTVKPLLLKPGKLTVDYVAGKRASFLHPIKLYIFISIVFFITIFSGKTTENQKGVSNKRTDTEKTDNNLFVTADINTVNRVLNNLSFSDEQKDSIINKARNDIKENGIAKVNLAIKKLGKNHVSLFNKLGGKTIEEYEKKQLALPPKERDNFIVHYFKKKEIEFNQYENPTQKIQQEILKNIPKMMFVLLPLFALILKLVYSKKKKYYFEHLIYSFHTHSALFLAITITTLLKHVNSYFSSVIDHRWLSLLCIIYIIWYIYKSLGTFYDSKRWATALNFLILNLCYGFLLTLCFLGIFAISFIVG